MVFRASLEFCDSYMLGEETIRTGSTRASHQPDWMFSWDGQPHPALCPECGIKVDHDLGHRLSFPKREYDISSTYDGYVILSRHAAAILRDSLTVSGALVPLPSEDWYWLNTWELPRAVIDIEKSGVRRSVICPECGRYTEVLFGLVHGSPPSPQPLVLRGTIPDSAVFSSDLEFGSGHSQSPVLFFSHDFGLRVQSDLQSGFELQLIE